MARRWRSPPESAPPRLPTSLSHPCGSRSTSDLAQPGHGTETLLEVGGTGGQRGDGRGQVEQGEQERHQGGTGRLPAATKAPPRLSTTRNDACSDSSVTTATSAL